MFTWKDIGSMIGVLVFAVTVAFGLCYGIFWIAQPPTGHYRIEDAQGHVWYASTYVSQTNGVVFTDKITGQDVRVVGHVVITKGKP